MTDCKANAQSLAEWFDTAQGDYVLNREQAYFDRTVADIFGFNALQIGLLQYEFLRTSRMPLRTRAGEGEQAQVRLCHDELPFDGESIDLLLLPHVLEFAEQPHPILREVARVLRPEGNLIVSGFNPISMWGVRRALGGKEGYPWCGEFIALKRLKDWLSLLDFVVVEERYTAHAPPFNLSASLARSHLIETAGERWWAVSGGVYFLHAIKRVPGGRLIQPKWNKKMIRSLVPVTPKINPHKTHKDHA